MARFNYVYTAVVLWAILEVISGTTEIKTPVYCSTQAVCCPGEECSETENVEADVIEGCMVGEMCTGQGCMKDPDYKGPTPPPRRKCPKPIQKCQWVPSCYGKGEGCQGAREDGCQPHFICEQNMGHCEPILMG